MEMIKELLNCGGYITKETSEKFAKFFPNMPIVIKFGNRPRKVVRIRDLESETSNLEGDYVREIFISAENYQNLCDIFGLNF